MSNRLLFVIISSLLFLILIAGCNKGSSPTLPDANGDISQQSAELDLSQFPEGRTVIGAFNAEINFETGEATVEPMRTGANHFSIFLNDLNRNRLVRIAQFKNLLACQGFILLIMNCTRFLIIPA